MASNLSEREIIRLASQRSNLKVGGLVKGIGDDCAVFGSSADGSWLVTTDTLVEGVHFDMTFHPPQLLGRKCVAVSLSDIAAMGGVPRFILISISIPTNIPDTWLTSWLDGVTEIAEEYNCSLIGGDTVQAGELSITVTLLGEAGSSGVIYRSGAGEDDTVYVSGYLGDSAVGLELLQSQLAGAEDDKWPEFIKAHLDPVPQVYLGQQLAQSGLVTSMQDISDGLATDLSHICHESGLAAILTEPSLPQNPRLKKVAEVVNKDILDLQLFSGEDYQLVFTVQYGRESEVESMLAESHGQPIHAVGRLRKGSGVQLRQIDGELLDITFKGYEHTMRASD